MAVKPPNTIQRARICVFANENSTVFVSAAVTPTIVVRIDGEFPAIMAPDVPIFWLSENDMVKALGNSSWDRVIKRLGFGLPFIPIAEWGEDRLLGTLRLTCPTIELMTLDFVQ